MIRFVRSIQVKIIKERETMKEKNVSRVVSLILIATLILSNISITSFATGIEDNTQAMAEESDEITTFSTKESTLAPGITQTINSAYAADGRLINYYVAVADISRDDVGVHTTYKDAQCTTTGMAQMTEQAASMEALHQNPEDEDNYIPYYAIVAGVNGDGYNTGSGKPSGAHVMNGVVGFGISKSANSPWFAIFEDGTALCGTNNTDWDQAVKAHGNAVEAIGGFQLVRKNGVDIPYGSAESGPSDYLNDGRYPRSFVGVTSDNKVVFMEVDGNNAGGSVGSNYAESLELMKEQDCTYILCLDGGGSATYISRPEGSNDIQVTSVPSDGSERAVSNGLVMYSCTPPSDVFEKATVSAENEYVTPGAKVSVSAIGVSPAGTAAEIPENAEWNATRGTIENGVFISDGTLGDAVISLVVDGKVVGSTTIHVVRPDSIKFTRTLLTVPFGATVELEVVAKYGLYDVLLQEGDILFTLSDSTGGFISGNKYTAPESGTGTTIIATAKGTEPAVTDTIEVKLGKGSEVIFSFEEGTAGADLKNWGLGDHGSGTHIYTDLSIVNEETGKVHNGEQALAFNYHMDQAIHGTEFWAGNQIIWLGDSIELKNATSWGFWLYIPEDATHLAMWVGTATHDENGNMNGWTGYEAVEYTDSKYENPEYSGWHYIKVPVTKDAVYIEDNSDQINKYFNGTQFKYKTNCFIKFYAVNIESWKNNETNYAGDFTFYIDDITVDYSDAVDDREEPVFSKMTYAVEGMSDAATLNGQTVSKNVVNLAGHVEEDMTSPYNASGLDEDTAVVYIDGVEVDCAYANGLITADAVLTDGVHTIRMGISDKMGNYAETKRQITVNTGNDDASVRVRPHDSTLNYILNDAVYWVDVEVDAIETVQSVETKLDLDSMNNWEAEYMKVLHGFDCEYRFATASEKAENILTLKFTRNEDYLSETGTTVLANIPIRVWDYVASDDHTHKNAVEAWKCNYVCAPALSIDVDTEMGLVTYLNDTAHTFSSKDIHTLCVSYTYGLRMRDFDKEYYNSHSYHAHAQEVIADLSATCTEDGYTGRTYCKTCESVVKWGTIEKATGHEFTINDGVLKCSCGQTFTGTWTDSKAYVDGIVVADGWSNDSYWMDGEKLTGVQFVDGYYYDFGEDGVCDGKVKYTGLFYDETVESYRYAKQGELYGGWVKIDTYYHYFKSWTKVAASGEYTVSGITYQFDEKGMTLGTWHTTEEGTRYYYGGGFYKARVADYETFVEIDGKTYNFNNNGYVTAGTLALRPAAFILKKNIYQFDETGVLLGQITTPGLVKCTDGATYYVNEEGYVPMDAGLVKYNGDYYYVVYSGKLKQDAIFKVTEEQAAKYGLQAKDYYFGADCKMVIVTEELDESKTGIYEEEGLYYYYVSGVKQKNLGLVKIGEDYYYVCYSGKLKQDANFKITEEQAAKYGLQAKDYYFGPDCKMIIVTEELDESKTGIYEEEGLYYYYVSGVKQKNLGLVKIGEDYYYVCYSGKLKQDANFKITEEQAAKYGLQAKDYYFGADCKMML